MANDIFSKLSKIFSITTKKDMQGNKVVVPATFDAKGKIKPVSFIGNKDSEKEFKRVWDFWVKNTYDSPETLKNRTNRYRDLEFMYYNDSIAAMAMDLVADETISAGAEDQEVGVYAQSSKFEKAIKDFFVSRELRGQNLRDKAFDLACYGDGFFINSVTTEGVKKVIPTSVFDVKQRLDFSLSKVSELMHQNSGYNQIINKQQGLVDLYTQLTGKSDDVSEAFEEFLFGYALSGEMWLAPWAITHFRRYSSRSEFWPFGKSPFIHMIGPYRQFSSTLNLQAMARIASFPLKHFQVKTDERMTEIEKWAAVSEARQEFANLGVSNTGKDEFTINDELWTPEDLLSIDVIENRMDIDKIGDLEMLQDRMVAAARIPKSYLPFGDGARLGSESGKSLIQQSKMFARFVYPNQQALLEGLSFLIKMHFALTGEFEGEEFEISLPYPVTEENSDVLRSKQDTLRLAKDVLDNLGQALGIDRDEALPVDVVKDVMSKYSFLDSEEVDKWVKSYLDSKETNMEESKKGRIRERYYKTREVTLRETHFNSIKETTVYEGVRAGKHFYSSFVSNRENDALLELFKKKNSNKLQESLKNSKMKISLTN